MQLLSRLLLSLLLSLSAGYAATLTDASITEFLASNQESLADEDGISSDWIEIQNTSGVSGDLGGWYLTDDPENLTLWPIPATEIPSGGYLLVFASGNDRSSTPHHTNFRLQSSSGGYLALVKPDGITIATEFIDLPEQKSDISYGEGFYLTPTPNAANTSSIIGFVDDTSFSMDRGFYDAPINVEITTLTEAATIRYTTDGTPPSSTVGTVYSGPITIAETTIIRAIAYKAGFQPTNIDTHTYVFPASVVGQPRMLTSITQSGTYAPQMIDSLKSVPTISIVADNPTAFLNENGPNITTESQTSVEMIYPDGTPGFQEDGGLSNFGGQHTNFNKKNFRVNFRSEFGAKKLKHPIFAGFDYPNFQPAEEFDVLNLRSGSHDMLARGAYMSNRFTDDTMLEMGNIAPHGRFVHVYLNGNYWGQYHLRERWNADMAASYFGGSKDDYEAINANNSGREFYTGLYDGSNTDGNIYDGSGVEWEQARSLLAGPSPFTNVAGQIDVANAIDFMLLWTSGDSESEFRAFGSPANGLPFKFFIKDADGFLRTPNDTHHPVTHNGPLNIMTRMRIDNNPDYNILLADRIHQHFFNDGALTPTKNIDRLQKRVDEAQLGFISEAARWSNHYRTPTSWEAYQNNLLNNHFVTLTASQLVKLRNAGMYPAINAPALSQHGGSIPSGAGITMATNTTAIYYTTDGSDPRLSGGALSPTAILATFDGDVREPEVFIEAGSTWSYLDDGSNQGTAWQQSNFDDSTWASGPAQLGYGESDLATTVGFLETNPELPGIQRNATTYYRHTVTIDNPSDFSNFLVQIRYDDGAAIYVNGVEVARTDNLPINAGFDTFATTSSPSETLFFDYPVSSARFVDGENTIAVEIHNSSSGSSDTRFDLVLRGQIDLSNGNNVTEALVLSGPTELKARSYNSTTSEWSALTSTFFSLDSIPANPSNIVISEIHYRPANPTTAAELAVSTDRDDFEFIELLNTGTLPIDLTGVSFDAGIDFHFADNTIIEAGGRIVIVKNLSAFTARYGTPPAGTIAGEYGGRLSNDGEQLILLTTGNVILQDLTYNDQLPWPALTDGEGYSMIFTGSDQTLGGDWSTNAILGGSPGEANIPKTNGYDDWKLARGITNDDSDHDSDGLSAFAEYAFGTDPFSADTSAIAGQVITIGSDKHLAVSYPQNLEATDVIFTIEQSSDLQTWTTVTAPVLVGEVTSADALTKQVTSRLPSAITPDSRRFLRVSIAQ